FKLADLSEELQNRIQAQLRRTGKEVPSETRLSEVFGKLNSPAPISNLDSDHARNRTLSRWLRVYDEKKCSEYTGAPLARCEKGNLSEISEVDCIAVADYAKHCKYKHKCNPHFDRNHICSADSDFEEGR